MPKTPPKQTCIDSSFWVGSPKYQLHAVAQNTKANMGLQHISERWGTKHTCGFTPVDIYVIQHICYVSFSNPSVGLVVTEFYPFPVFFFFLQYYKQMFQRVAYICSIMRSSFFKKSKIPLRLIVIHQVRKSFSLWLD